MHAAKPAQLPGPKYDDRHDRQTCAACRALQSSQPPLYVCAGATIGFCLRDIPPSTGSMLCQLIERLREGEWWGEEVAGVTDRLSCSTVMAGLAGVKAVFEVGWTECKCLGLLLALQVGAFCLLQVG